MLAVCVPVKGSFQVHRQILSSRSTQLNVQYRTEADGLRSIYLVISVRVYRENRLEMRLIDNFIKPSSAVQVHEY